MSTATDPSLIAAFWNKLMYTPFTRSIVVAAFLVITSTREVVFSPVSLYWFVCQQGYTKIIELNCTKLGEEMEHEPGKNLIHFRADPDHSL